MLDDQIAWYIAGPVVGLCVVMCRLLFNARLGVTGGYSEIVDKTSRGSFSFDWRGWFALGVLASGLLYLVLRGSANFDGYGWMTRTFEGSGQLLMVPILLVSGILIGYGAKVAGGCTSGNGLSGTSSFSPAGFVATGTFFVTAIVVTVAIDAVI